MKFIFCFLLIPLNVFPQAKSICANSDDRVVSNKPEVGRIFNTKQRRRKKICTATLISDRCAITAGHCRKHLKFVEFNTPNGVGRQLRHSEDKDIYLLDKSFDIHINNGKGDDWGVFKLKPNKLTGMYPGETQGYLEVSFKDQNNHLLEMYGHGISMVSDMNYAQQRSYGKLEGIKGSNIYHAMDSKGGSSGSAIINSKTGQILGIHTHGGCNTDGANQGTYIPNHIELQKAIKKCLRTE